MSDLTSVDRKRAMEIIGSLMLSDNLGDVHEATDSLRELFGAPPLEGDYLDGWTDGDWRSIGDPYGARER